MTSIFLRLDNCDEEDEIFLTSCDLTVASEIPLTQMKGCIIKSNIIIEDENDNGHLDKWKDFWKNFLCCKPCIKICNDSLWKLSVRYAKCFPNNYQLNNCCNFVDTVGVLLDYYYIQGSVNLYLKFYEMHLISYFFKNKYLSISFHRENVGTTNKITLLILDINKTVKKEQLEGRIKSAKPISSINNIKNKG